MKDIPDRSLAIIVAAYQTMKIGKNLAEQAMQEICNRPDVDFEQLIIKEKDNLLSKLSNKT